MGVIQSQMNKPGQQGEKKKKKANSFILTVD